MMHSQEDTTHFGYQTILRKEKAAHVRGVFDSVASRYDLMNDLMSGGMHRQWKKAMVAQIPLHPAMKLLDLAGGTGDIAFRYKERYQQSHNAVAGQITICDINANMLAEGQKRAIDRNILSGVNWLCANAELLPLENNSVDACTIAFGIRNVTDIPKALQEIHRVLKPGGGFFCLEFTPPDSAQPVISSIYDFYSFQLIPRMGKMVTGDADSYQYLVESIRRFPPAEQFKHMIENAGFSRVKYETFTFGVVALHKGWKI